MKIKTSFENFMHLMDIEILHFRHLGAEKIEFEVEFQNFWKMTIFQFSFLGGYLNLRQTCTFQIFFLLSDDIVDMKYLRKKIFFDWRLCLKIKISTPQKIENVSFFKDFWNLTYQLCSFSRGNLCPHRACLWIFSQNPLSLWPIS